MGPCPACGHAPRGEERPLAYLFSSHHLSESDLDDVALLIQRGERPDPPEPLLQLARSQLTASRSVLPVPQDPQPRERQGLSREEVWLLVLGNVVATPLVGLAVWWGWRRRHPRAARQVLWATLPVAVALGALWIALIFLAPSPPGSG